MLEKDICVKDIHFVFIYFCVVELINKYSEYTWEKAQCLTEKDGTKYKEWNTHGMYLIKCQSPIYLR